MQVTFFFSNNKSGQKNGGGKMHRVPFPILQPCSLITTPTTSKIRSYQTSLQNICFFFSMLHCQEIPDNWDSSMETITWEINGQPSSLWEAAPAAENLYNRFCNHMPCGGTKKKSGTLSRLQHLPTRFTILKNISANMPESPFRRGLKVFLHQFPIESK